MLDIKKLRESLQEVKDSLSSRGYDIDQGLFLSLDEKRKVLQITVENLQAERKKLSAEYGKLKASGDDIEQLKSTIDENNTELESKDKELQIILIQINDFLLDILLKSPQNSVFLDIGAYNGDTSIYISKKLKEKNRGSHFINLQNTARATTPASQYSRYIKTSPRGRRKRQSIMTPKAKLPSMSHTLALGFAPAGRPRSLRPREDLSGGVCSSCYKAL